MEKREKPRSELVVREIAWSRGSDRPAGIFWLGGRCVMAGHDTPAEAGLLDAGAIPVATLAFEPDPREGRRPGAVVERIALPAFRRRWEGGR